MLCTEHYRPKGGAGSSLKLGMPGSKAGSFARLYTSHVETVYKECRKGHPLWDKTIRKEQT